MPASLSCIRAGLLVVPPLPQKMPEGFSPCEFFWGLAL